MASLLCIACPRFICPSITVKKSPFGPPIIPEGLEVSTGNPMYDKVLVFIKKDDSEAGLDVHTDFAPLGREFFYF